MPKITQESMDQQSRIAWAVEKMIKAMDASMDETVGGRALTAAEWTAACLELTGKAVRFSLREELEDDEQCRGSGGKEGGA